jgi:hypothetical protein
MDKKSKFLKWVLAVGIVIVLNLFFNYTIALFYTSPNYDNYCGALEQKIVPITEEECISSGGAWSYTPYRPVPVSIAEKDIFAQDGYCDLYASCREEYDVARTEYQKNVFMILILLGTASIFSSFLFTAYEAVSLGISVGGVLSIVVGSLRYWSDAPDIIRVIILAIALGTLIWMGIKKIRD